jgi:hypothetical protein
MKMLIIDEISMSGQGTVADISRHLVKIYQVLKPFAGKNVVFVGDHFQLPPVLDNKLYSLSKAGDDQRKRDGSKLYYSTVTNEIKGNVVLLDTIMRTENAEYVNLQNKARLGTMRYEIEAKKINEECYKAPQTSDTQTHIPTLPASPNPTDKDNNMPDYKPMAVVKNETRKKLHDSLMKSLSQHYKENNTDLPIILTGEFSNVRIQKRTVKKNNTKKQKTSGADHTSPITKQENTYLQELTDNKLDRMMPIFYLYIGAYILVSHNLGIGYGLANGTHGRIVGWQFPEGTKFRETLYKGIHVREPYNPNTNAIVTVEFVLIQLTSTTEFKKAPNQPAGLGFNIVAIPVINHTMKNQIPIPPHISKTRKSLKLKMKQIPLRQADVLTTYSIQGCQFSSFIIAESVPSQFYLMFSRGKFGLPSITLQTMLTKQFIKNTKPSQALTNEMIRLQRLHNITKERFNNTHPR